MTYIKLLLCVWIKVMDEWQISLDYVRGSNIYVRGYLDLRAWSLRLRTKTEENHYVKALFPSRERCFSLRCIRRILAIRRRACVSLRRGISGSYIDDQSLMPRYGSRALGGKGREGQNLSTFVWVLIHPWRWLAWASMIEKPLSVSPIVGLQSDFLHP